jgi:hypothetical protein
MRVAAGTLVAPVAVVGVALALAACSSPYPGTTLGQQVQSWARATGFSAAIGTLRTDAERVLVVSARGDTGGLRTVCDVLVTDALRANQNLPAPDSRLSAILTGAYRSAAAAGNGCLHSAGEQHGLPLVVTDELVAARSGYTKAQARLDLLELSTGGGS